MTNQTTRFHGLFFKTNIMAKRKLTEKLKQQIKENPYKLRKGDFTGEALHYLNRVRGARKAVKTKIAKAKYKAPRLKKEGEQAGVKDLIAGAAKSKGMSVKKFRQKYKQDVEEFERTAKLYHNREADLLINDIRFAEQGRGIFVNGKRVTRAKAIYRLSRFKGKVMSTGLTYERINIEYNVDAKGNIHFALPTMEQLNEAGEENDMLDYIEDSFPISVYRK